MTSSSLLSKSLLYNCIPVGATTLSLLVPYLRYRWSLLTHNKYSESTKPVFYMSRVSKFVAILFGIHSLFSYIVFGRFGAHFHVLPFSVHLYLQSMVVIQWYTILVKRKLMPLWFRLLISWPSYTYFAAIWFGVVFSPLEMLRIVPSNTYIACIALSLGIFGMYQSLIDPKFCREVVNIDLSEGRLSYSETTEKKYAKSIPLGTQTITNSSRVLNVFQITDSHLGPFMSEKRMRRICQNIVDHSHTIDLVLITGDLETIGSHESEEALESSLAPLKEIKGKVFACLGNHDYETLDRVRRAMKNNDITLLEDEEAIVETRVGRVQIIGSIFTFSGTSGSQMHIENLCAKYPAIDHVPRIMLIHNPSVFPMIPLNNVDIVFSGHYHGGQISFFGITTLLQIFSKIKALVLKIKKRPNLIQYPDNGLYAIGKSRLYCHRGTGHYGFPLRLGVPSEQSLIRLHL